jgi:hypothetical protein
LAAPVRLRQELGDELPDRIKTCSLRLFEKLVVDLLRISAIVIT